MQHDNKPRTVSFGRLALIFISMMFLFLVLLASQTSEKLAKESERQLRKQLEASLDRVIARTSDESFVHDRFMTLVETAAAKGITSPELENAVAASANEFKVPVKAFFYRHNKLVKAFNADNNDLKFFSELMADLNSEGKAYELAQRRVHQTLLDTFGAGNRLELIKDAKGRQKRNKYKDGDRFYYWNTWPDGLGVFFVTTGFPGFIERFKLAYPNSTMFGAGDPDTKSWVAPNGISADHMAAAHIKARLQGRNNVTAHGYRWYFLDDETGAFWCRALSETAAELMRPRWADKLYSIAALLLCINLILYLSAITGLYPGVWVRDWLDTLSIRYRIMGLFAMASVFPIIFAVLIGSMSIADRKEIIENSVIAESIAAIEPLEKMYKIRIAQSEALGKDLRNALIHETPSEEMFQRYLKKHSLPRFLARLEVRDGDGQTIFSTDDRQIHGVAEAMDILSRMVIRLHAPSRMSRSAASRISPAEIVSESVMTTDEMGMATIMRLRGRQWQFHMGTFPTTWFWDVYPEIASGPGFMCQTNQLLEIYLKQVEETLSGKQPENGSIQLATELNYHFSRFKIFPPKQGFPEEKLLRAAVSSFRANRVMFREFVIDGKKFWATFKPEKHINSHIFIHLISQDSRLKTLAPFKWSLAAGSLFALVISILGATLITRLTILPISDLSAGITAIRERRHNFEIPVRRSDEFGALAGAFNKVISELKELEYGRIVQESLLPQAPIVPEGFDIAFFNTSATDLAGDYHDCVPLNDGRLAIILGDVTGHGISAALAMAMAKATVNYAAADGKLFPAGLMDMLNALFNRELKPRHKFMTLVTLVLNPKTGEVEIDNAGQSYPRFFKHAEGASEEIELPGMPLGAMKKRRSQIARRTMQSNDAIILYTDGIIECADLSGDMFGYDRFRESFERLMRQKTTANDALKAMMHELDAFRQPGPYPDDVTLVIIRKL